MLKYKNYAYGNVNEIAEWIVGVMKLGDCGQAKRNPEIRVDFASYDMDEPTAESDLEDVYSNAEGWYGIKQVHMGFSNDDLELFVDYYGGGSGVYRDVCEGVTETVKEMLIDTLDQRGNWWDGANIIAERVGWGAN